METALVVEYDFWDLFGISHINCVPVEMNMKILNLRWQEIHKNPIHPEIHIIHIHSIVHLQPFRIGSRRNWSTGERRVCLLPIPLVERTSLQTACFDWISSVVG